MDLFPKILQRASIAFFQFKTQLRLERRVVSLFALEFHFNLNTF